MGRPLTKRFFGNTNEGNTGGEGVASVTVGGTNTLYTTRPTITFAAPTLPAGTTATGTSNMGLSAAVVNAGGTTGYLTGDVLTLVGGTFTEAATITIVATAGAVTGVSSVTPGNYTALPGTTAVATTTVDGGDGTATFNLTFLINSITVTTAGSGYATAPAVTVTGNATLTAVLTAANHNGIIAYAYTNGSAKIADIVKQVGTRHYKVTTADSTVALDDRAVLKNGAATAVGEMTIKATDSLGSTYYVTKLTRHRATVRRDTMGTGWVFADLSIAHWTLEAATATTVQIENT